MAENLNPIETTENIQSLEKIANETEDNGSDVSKIRETLEGFTPIVKDTEEIKLNTRSIANAVDGETGWFYKTLTQILGYYESEEEDNVEVKSLQESMADSLSGILDFNDITATENKLDKKENKKKPKMNGQFNDLKELPFIYGTLGAVLTNAINDNKKGEKKGISGFFKGIMEGIGGIASLGVALLAFAGATLLFNFVDWGKAVIGMVAFTIFTLGMVTIAKNLSAEQKDLIKFAESSLIMSAALGTFAISLYIASALMSLKSIEIGSIKLPAFDIGGAIIALVSFGIFEKGMASLAKKVGKDSGDFVNFAAGSLLMSAALVTFSVGLVIASNIFANGINIGPFAKYINGGADNTVLKVDPIGAIAAVGTFLLFETGLAGVARIMGNSTGDFVKFAIGSMIMTGALVAFTLSLVVVSSIVSGQGISIGEWTLPGIDVGAAIGGVAIFLGFLLGVVGITFIAQNFMGQIAIFGAVSLLMSTALIFFSFAMVAAGLAVAGGNADLGPLGHFSVPEGTGLKSIGAIGVMAGFMAAFAGLGAMFLVPFAGQAMLAGIMMASGVLLAIGGTVIVMAKAMALAGLITSGGEMEWEGKKFTMIPMDESKIDASFNPFFTLMDKVVEMGKKIKGQGGFFPWQRKKGVDEGAIRMVGSVAEVVSKVAECIAESMTIKKKVEDAGATWDVHVMDGCLDYVLQVVEKLGVVADSMGFWTAVKMPIIIKSMMPVIDAMDKIVDVIEKALTMRSRLEKEGVVFKGSGIDPEILNGICDPVLQVLLGPDMDGNGGLAAAADSMSFWGALMLPKITSSMVPIAETISILVDTIEKAATLGGNAENAKALIDQGVENMTYLMVGNGDTESSGFLFWKKETITGGFIGLFNTIAKGTETIGSAGESIKVMKDLVESLVAVFDAVGKLSGSDPGDINSVVDKFGRILGKKSSWSISFSWWDGFSVEKTAATGLMGIIEALAGVDTNELKNAVENSKSMKSMIEGVADMMKATSTLSGGEGFEKLANVPSFKHFSDSMDDFDTGMKWLAKAYNRVKDIPGKWIDSMSASFSEISEARLDNLDKMVLFSEKAKALGDTAANLNKIADAFHRINKENMQNSLLGAADKLGRLATDFLGNFQGQSVAEQKGSNEGEQSAKPVKKGEELAVIANILNEWNAKGVKVYGIDTGDKKKAVKTINI